MISVITITYNASKIIEDTIISIISQSNEQFELIIVDGASNDDTINIVSGLLTQSEFPKERFSIICEQDYGVYDAMNKGVRHAKGNYILFMNGGDSFYDRNVLSNFEKAIFQVDADVYYGNTLMDFYEGLGILSDGEDSIRNPTMPFIHQSVIVKRKFLLEHPFDISYRIVADHEFFYWLRQQKAEFVHLDFIVSRYDAKEGLSENNPLKIALEMDRIYGRTRQPHYFLRKVMLSCTVGLIQPVKNIFPRWLLNMYFRRKKTYITWISIY